MHSIFWVKFEILQSTNFKQIKVKEKKRYLYYFNQNILDFHQLHSITNKNPMHLINDRSIFGTGGEDLLEFD